MHQSVVALVHEARPDPSRSSCGNNGGDSMEALWQQVVNNGGDSAALHPVSPHSAPGGNDSRTSVVLHGISMVDSRRFKTTFKCTARAPSKGHCLSLEGAQGLPAHRVGRLGVRWWQQHGTSPQCSHIPVTTFCRSNGEWRMRILVCDENRCDFVAALPERMAADPS